MNLIEKYLLQFVLLPFVFFLLAQQCCAQVKIFASADENIIQQGDLIKLRFNIEHADEVQQFIPPSFKGCKVIDGPIHVAGSSAVNGIVSNSFSFIYTIQPQTSGNYSLSGASAKVNNQRLVFNAIKFKVNETKYHRNQNNFQNQYDELTRSELYSDYIIRKGENIHDKIRNNLFIKVDVNKKDCYEGEAVVATYKLYTRLHSESKVSKRPSFNGFSVYDMVDPSLVPATIETLNGKDFNVYLIRKSQLFPLQSGMLDLDPAEVENSISFVRAENVNRSSDYFPELLHSFNSDNISHAGIVTEKVSIKSNPLFINVKALPASAKPHSFDGAVGRFSIGASIDKSEIALNDAALLRIIIKGEGNFGVINAPFIRWPKEIEAYEPVIKEDFLKSIVPMRGYKTFAFTIMPKHTGKIKIAPVEFSYFDPQTGQYHTEITDSIFINALPAVQKNTDFLYTATNEKAALTSERMWVMLAAFLLLAGFGIALFRFIRTSGNRPVQINTESNIHKNIPDSQDEGKPLFLSNPLFNARLMLIQQNSRGFYSELDKTLWNYVNEKLQARDRGLNKKNIEQELRAGGVDDITISQFQLLIQQCEFALYTPVINESEMQSAYDLAEDLLDNMKVVMK